MSTILVGYNHALIPYFTTVLALIFHMKRKYWINGRRQFQTKIEDAGVNTYCSIKKLTL